MQTFLQLSEHPNIHGAKLSCDVDFIRQLYDRIGDKFRIITASPNLVDVCLKYGLTEHLDGVWAIMPGWTVALGECAARGDWEGAAKYQRQITEVRNLLLKYGFAAFAEMMNARGIPGDFVPRPSSRLSESQKETLLNEPIMKKLIEEDPAQV